MPKSQPTIDRELEHVLARATELYPKLATRRAAIAADLANVEAALARLDALAGTVRAVDAARPSNRVASKDPTTSLTPRKLEEPILFALGSFSAPVGSADLMKALHAKGVAVRPYPLQMALKRLRDQRRVRATGNGKRFLYELASSPKSK